jgi:hypothetical protein
MIPDNFDMEDIHIVPEERPYFGCPLIQGGVYQEGSVGRV